MAGLPVVRAARISEDFVPTGRLTHREWERAEVAHIGTVVYCRRVTVTHVTWFCTLVLLLWLVNFFFVDVLHTVFFLFVLFAPGIFFFLNIFFSLLFYA